MKVQVLEVSSYEREVEVELPPDDVRKAFDDALREVRKKARIPGFRPGKVPRNVLAQRFRPQLEETVIEALVEESLGPALARHGLVPVSRPIVDRGEAVEGRPFHYKLRFEVMPRVELEDYKGLTIPRFPDRVSDEQLEEALERKRQDAAELQPVEDRPAEEGDVVNYSYTGTIDGVPLAAEAADGLTATLGAGHAPAVFDQALRGRTTGEEFDVDVELPDDFPDPAQVGKRLVARVSLGDVSQRLVPALDDEFARDKDFDDLEAMRTALREEMDARQGKEAKRDRERAAIEAVLEKNSFDVPPSLVRGRTQMHLDETLDAFSKAGLDLTRLRSEDELRARVRKEVVFEVRRQVVLDALARQERIEITDADVEARMEEIATQSDTPLPKVRATYGRGEGRAELEASLKAQRVLDFLLTQTSIAEEPAD